MMNVAVHEVLEQLPTQELEATLETFLAPLTDRLPDERFRRTVPSNGSVERPESCSSGCWAATLPS